MKNNLTYIEIKENYEKLKKESEDLSNDDTKKAKSLKLKIEKTKEELIKKREQEKENMNNEIISNMKDVVKEMFQTEKKEKEKITNELISNIKNAIKEMFQTEEKENIKREMINKSEEIRDNVKKEIKESEYIQIREQVKNSLSIELRNELVNEIKNELRIKINQELRETEYEKIRGDVKNDLKNELKDVIQEEIKSEIREEVTKMLIVELKENLKYTLHEKLKEEIKEEIKNVSFNEIRNEIKKEIEETKKEEILNEIVKEKIETTKEIVKQEINNINKILDKITGDLEFKSVKIANTNQKENITNGIKKENVATEIKKEYFQIKYDENKVYNLMNGYEAEESTARTYIKKINALIKKQETLGFDIDNFQKKDKDLLNKGDLKYIEWYYLNFKGKNINAILNNKSTYKFDMEENQQKIKDYGLKKLSEKNYKVKLRYLIKNSVVDMDKFDEADLQKIIKLYPVANTQKFVLSAILWYINLFDENNKIISKIKETIKKLGIEMLKRMLTNELTEKQNKNYLPFSTIKEVYEQLKKEFKNEKDKDKKEKLHLEYLVLSLYVLFPCRRLEFKYLEINDKYELPEDEHKILWTNSEMQEKVGYYNELIKVENNAYDEKNYYVRKENNSFFVINNYKTNRVYGIQIIEIPKELDAIIKEYIKHKKLKDGEPLIKKRHYFYNNILVNIFKRIKGKNTSVCLIRHAFITSEINNKIKNDKDGKILYLSRLCGHSEILFSRYRNKNDAEVANIDKSAVLDKVMNNELDVEDFVIDECEDDDEENFEDESVYIDKDDIDIGSDIENE